MVNEILAKLLEWTITRMTTSNSRPPFTDEEIMERVRVSQRGASVSNIGTPPGSPVIPMILEIRNSLASSIELHSMLGDVQAIDHTIIDNFTRMLNETLKGHSAKCYVITVNLIDSKAKIVGHHRANNFDFDVSGTLVFNAYGRTLVKPIRLHVSASSRGLSRSKDLL